MQGPKPDTEFALMEVICDALSPHPSNGSTTSSLWSSAADKLPKLGPVFEAMARQHFPESYQESMMLQQSVESILSDFQSTQQVEVPDVEVPAQPVQRYKEAVTFGLPDSVERSPDSESLASTSMGLASHSNSSRELPTAAPFLGDSSRDALPPPKKAVSHSQPPVNQTADPLVSDSASVLLPGQPSEPTVATIPEEPRSSFKENHEKPDTEPLPELKTKSAPSRRCCIM